MNKMRTVLILSAIAITAAAGLVVVAESNQETPAPDPKAKADNECGPAQPVERTLDELVLEAGAERPSASSVGSCTRPCNSQTCPTPPCSIDINPFVQDLNLKCCTDNGVVLQCPVGTTVHATSNECGGDASCPARQKIHDCQ